MGRFNTDRLESKVNNIKTANEQFEKININDIIDCSDNHFPLTEIEELVSPKKKAQVYVVSEDAEIRDIFEQGKVFFATLGYASEVIIQDNKDGIGDDAVSSVIAGAVIYMPFAELVDIAKEKERLAKEEKRLNGEIKRCEGMLGNERFVSKAPEAKVQEEKDKLAKYQQMLEQVKEQIARIS